jgi:hypothetical protein
MATRMAETPNRATSTIKIRTITLALVARGLQATKAVVRRRAAFRVRDMVVVSAALGSDHRQ